MGRRVGWLACVAALVSCLGASRARACSPQTSTSYEVITPRGDRAPVDAAIIISGYVLGVGALAVTVDGVEAGLDVDRTLSQSRDGDGEDLLALRVVPTPSPGQTVHVVGNPCQLEPCPSLDVTYVATEPVPVTPPAPGEWWWNGADTGLTPEQASGYDSCGGPNTARVTVFLRPTVELLAAEAAFVRVSVSGTSSSVGGPDVSRVVSAAELGDGMVAHFGLVESQAGYPGRTGRFCVTMETLDARGVSSGLETRCAPCQRDGCHPDIRHCPIDLDPDTSDVAHCGCNVGAARQRSGGPAVVILFGALALVRRRTHSG